MKPIYHAIRLDRGGATPLCYQIKDYLMQYIRSGELSYGEMLPPEEELCVLLNVSRPTVRQALTDLVHEGYLNRVKFKGTFVTRPRLAGKFIQTIQTYDEEIQLNIFRNSQGASVLRAVTGSKEAEEILKRDTEEGDKIIDNELLSKVIENGMVTPRFAQYEDALAMAEGEVLKIYEDEKNVDSSLKIAKITLEHFLSQ